MRRIPALALLTLCGLLAVPLLVLSASTAGAQQAGVGLGTAGAFGVLGGSTVTNTGPTVINGNLGVSPGNAITGFPPGQVNGTTHPGDATAAQAQSDLTVAFNDAAGRACDVNLTGQDLGGKTLTPGAHCYSAAAQLTGTVTLNAQGNENAVFIFQIGSTLTTASASSVNLINGAQACNVFWQVGSSATLGTSTSFKGNILAGASITLNTNATIVQGRALARAGAVTMDTNTLTRATCQAAPPAPTTSPSATTSPTPTPTPTGSPTATTSPTATPGPTPTPGLTPAPTTSPGATPLPTPLPGDPADGAGGDGTGSGDGIEGGAGGAGSGGSGGAGSGGSGAGGIGRFPAGGAATGGGSTASSGFGLLSVGAGLFATALSAVAVVFGAAFVRRGVTRRLRRG